MAKKAEKSNNDLVPVMLFKDNGKYKDDVTVGLNGRIWRIKRGVTVMVPREVREIIDHSQYQDTQTANMISGYENDFKAKEKAYT